MGHTDAGQPGDVPRPRCRRHERRLGPPKARSSSTRRDLRAVAGARPRVRARAAAPSRRPQLRARSRRAARVAATRAAGSHRGGASAARAALERKRLPRFQLRPGAARADVRVVALVARIDAGAPLRRPVRRAPQGRKRSSRCRYASVPTALVDEPAAHRPWLGCIAPGSSTPDACEKEWPGSTGPQDGSSTALDLQDATRRHAHRRVPGNLSLRRFESRWVQGMLPCRMPRQTGLPWGGKRRGGDAPSV